MCRGRYFLRCCTVFLPAHASCAKYLLRVSTSRRESLPVCVRCCRNMTASAKLEIQCRSDGDMVGRSLPRTQLLGHAHIADTVGNRRRDPYMIEPAAFVRPPPIRRPVAPPGVELGWFRH